MTASTLKNKIWDEFIYGGHLISLGPTIIAYIFMRISNFAISWQLLIGLYLITYLVHLIDRYVDVQNESSSDKSMYYAKMKKFLPVIILISSAILVFLLKDSIVMILFAIFVVAIGALYTVFFKKLTRYILGFKSYYTAAVFAASVIFTAFYYQEYKFTPILLLTYTFFFLRWFSNTIFCDLKDVKEDSGNYLKTFATQLSKKRFYNLLYLINVMSMLVIIIGVSLGYFPMYALTLILAPIYSFYYLELSKRTRANYQNLANVWADGESIVWLVLIFFGRLI